VQNKYGRDAKEMYKYCGKGVKEVQKSCGNGKKRCEKVQKKCEINVREV